MLKQCNIIFFSLPRNDRDFKFQFDQSIDHFNNDRVNWILWKPLQPTNMTGHREAPLPL